MSKQCMLVIKLSLLIQVRLPLQVDCYFIRCFLDFAGLQIFIICFIRYKRHASYQGFQNTIIIEKIFRTVAQTLAVIILSNVVDFLLLDCLHLSFLFFVIVRVFIQWYILNVFILSNRLSIIGKNNMKILIRFFSAWVSVSFNNIIVE